MFLPLSVCLSVCLSVYLCPQTLMKSFGGLDCDGYPDHDTDAGS